MEQADDQYPEKPVEMRQLPITPGKVPGATGGGGGGGGFRTTEPEDTSFHKRLPIITGIYIGAGPGLSVHAMDGSGDPIRMPHRADPGCRMRLSG